jgi:hypothetical protein
MSHLCFHLGPGFRNSKAIYYHLILNSTLIIAPVVISFGVSIKNVYFLTLRGRKYS